MLSGALICHSVRLGVGSRGPVVSEAGELKNKHGTLAIAAAAAAEIARGDGAHAVGIDSSLPRTLGSSRAAAAWLASSRATVPIRAAHALVLGHALLETLSYTGAAVRPLVHGVLRTPAWVVSLRPFVLRRLHNMSCVPPLPSCALLSRRETAERGCEKLTSQAYSI